MKKINNKSGQLDFPIIQLVIVIFAIILIAIITLKVWNSIQTPLMAQVQNLSVGGQQAAQAGNYVFNTGINFWDKFLITVFVIQVLLLLVSAFLVDTHPFWLVFWIILCFMTVLFAPNVIASLDKLYEDPNFALEYDQLTYINNLRIHFAEYLLGIMVFSGVIVYAKLKFSKSV